MESTTSTKSETGAEDAAKKMADEKSDAEDAAALATYRQFLVEAEKQGQESFDKTVLSLSGGALGISFVFIKDVIGEHSIAYPLLLLLAWIFWALSALAILASFYTSNRALRRAIEQCDDKTIRCKPPGGYFSKITRNLNLVGIVCLILGILQMSIFVYANLLQREHTNDHKTNAAAGAPNSTANATPDANTAPTAASGEHAKTPKRL